MDSSESDYTIGDLWGDSQFPQEHFQGVSALIVHNGYAKRLIKKMAPYLEVHAIEERYVTTYNNRISNGRKRRKYFVERMFLGWIFNHFSYSTLKRFMHLITPHIVLGCCTKLIYTY